MKKIIRFLFIVFLLIFFAAAPVLAVGKWGVIADNQYVKVADLDAMPGEENSGLSANQTGTVDTQYTFPYPGILIDHPLYFLKRIRDQIMAFLITNPVKKIEFSILQSDKYFSMAEMYKSDNNWAFLFKALNLSYAQAEGAYKQALAYKQNTGQLPQYLVEKMQKSLAAHLQIISSYSEDTKGDQATGLESQISQIRNLQKNLNKLSN